MKDISTIASIHAKISQAKSIVITSHKSPDGDSVGSSLGLYHYLKAKGKMVSICHPDPYPNFLSWLMGVDEIVNFESDPGLVKDKIASADLVFALDYNDPSRVGPMADLMQQSGPKTIMIDHHLHPSDFATLTLSVPEACSTAELVFEVIATDQTFSLNENIANALYLGILTDTGSFRFPSVTPRTHEILSVLLKTPIKHSLIHENVFDQNSLSQLKLNSFAINQKLELLQNDLVALISLTEDELTEYNYQKGDTEGLVNTALSIKGVKMAIFLNEKEGAIKMSFRSKQDVTVNKLASENFEGGGHGYAAGGISYLSMNETISKIKSLLPSYV